MTARWRFSIDKVRQITVVCICVRRAVQSILTIALSNVQRQTVFQMQLWLGQKLIYLNERWDDCEMYTSCSQSWCFINSNVLNIDPVLFGFTSAGAHWNIFSFAIKIKKKNLWHLSFDLLRIFLSQSLKFTTNNKHVCYCCLKQKFKFLYQI